MSDWYDRQGKKLVHADMDKDKATWLKEMDTVEELLKDKNYKVVQQDYTEQKQYWVSTVWLGLDQSYIREEDEADHKPLIFETMVFDKRSDAEDSTAEMNRYTTEQEASEAHQYYLRKYNVIERAKSHD